jgi:hypothetical protein
MQSENVTERPHIKLVSSSSETAISQPQSGESFYKPFRRPIAVILADLSKPIPKKYLATRKQGGATLTYLPWFNCCKLLDRCAPGWEGRVTHMHTTHDRIFVTYCLTIHAEEGSFTREATGTELLKEEKEVWVGEKPNRHQLKDELSRPMTEARELAYGDPSSNAESMAFRRAAAKFGLGLYLYEKD